MCLFHVSFQNRSGSDHVPAHDEFSSARKVSPLNRAMRMSGFIRLRRTAAPGAIGICALSLIAAASASAADDASPWDGDARSAVRLIAGSAGAGKVVRAGVEIRLKSGWHTYWRYPGDAGVPPRFDFTGSQNVKAVDVLWPAPQPIPEHDLVTIGYTGDVILPLAVVLENGAKPVKLRLKLDYAVCETLCVPAEGKAELVLTGGSSSQPPLELASLCSPKDRRRIGRCRCRRRSTALQPACNASPSRSKVHRRERRTKAFPSRSPP